MTRSVSLPAVAMLGLAAVACQAPSTRTPADRQARAACREAVDRVYQAQNRADLSRRDDRDAAFAGGYVSGIVTRGISSRYGRDQMVSECVQSAGEPGGQTTDTGTSPTFSPATPAQR